MNDEVADESLMERYRDGDAGAFDVLYQRHKGGLYRYLLRLVRQPSLADELFQEVWSNLIRSRERYQPSAKFSTFLYQIAHHRVIDHIRQTPEAALSLDAENDEGESLVQELPDTHGERPDELAARKRVVAAIVSAVEALPALQREAFLLREEADLSLEEIAAATGVNTETAKSRLRYAVAKLREGLRGLR